jgi:hypothetical protein
MLGDGGGFVLGYGCCLVPSLARTLAKPAAGIMRFVPTIYGIGVVPSLARTNAIRPYRLWN